MRINIGKDEEGGLNLPVTRQNCRLRQKSGQKRLPMGKRTEAFYGHFHGRLMEVRAAAASIFWGDSAGAFHDFSHAAENGSGTVGVCFQSFHCGYPGEHQNCGHAALQAGD